MATLSRIRNEWANIEPVMVHGFLGRMEAERKLRGHVPGTFLLRFSESRPGGLVVSFTDTVGGGLAERVSRAFRFGSRRWPEASISSKARG